MGKRGTLLTWLPVQVVETAVSEGPPLGADAERKLRAESVLAEQLGKQGRGPACANTAVRRPLRVAVAGPLCRALNTGTELPGDRGQDARTR